MLNVEHIEIQRTETYTRPIFLNGDEKMGSVIRYILQGDDRGQLLVGICEHYHHQMLRDFHGYKSGHNHIDTQHRKCTGTFTPSGGKSERQRGESGLSKPQRSVGGCRNETKKTTATASHIKKVLLCPKDSRKQRLSLQMHL